MKTKDKVVPIHHNTEFFKALDAMENLVASIGNGHDVRSFTEYREKFLLQRPELETLYIENWMAGKVIDIIPDDMTREWRTVNSTVDPDKVKEFHEFEEDLDVCGKFNEASKWARLYGGAGIVMGLNEMTTGSPEEPLDLDTVQKGDLTHLTVIENERLYYDHQFITDPTSPFFGEPEFLRIAQGHQRIHRSRVLIFNGIKLPYYMKRRQRLQYWGASVLRRVIETIQNSDLGVNGIASLMAEASVDVIKYKGLTSFLSQPGGEEKIRARFALMKLLKSVNNTTLLDEDESFENHQQAFSGIGELIEKYLALVAGASDIPVTRLIGTSAKGLNATGEGDLKNYYDNIRARQKREYNPPLRVLDQVMQRSLWGEPAEEWDFVWNSLFQLSEKEIAEMENARADRDTKYLDAGVIDELVVAQQVYEDGTYSNVDQAFLDELEKTLKQLKADAEQAKLNPPPQPGLPAPDDGGNTPDDNGDELLEFS